MSTIEAWFYALPPFTKSYLVVSIASTLLAEIGIISPYSYLLSWHKILHGFEIWRLVTPFVFFGMFSHMLLFNFAVFPPSFYWGMLFISFCLLVVGYFLELQLLGLSLIFTMMYIWSKYEPETIVNFFWGFKVKGFQLPFAFMVLNIITGGSLVVGLVGIVIGEIFYLLKEKVPHDYGWDILTPPLFFANLVDKAQRPGRAPQAGFQGRGQRLG